MDVEEPSVNVRTRPSFQNPAARHSTGAFFARSGRRQRCGTASAIRSQDTHKASKTIVNERGWAWMNPASLSTREMGPGARADTLDDQWGSWNYRLVLRLGM